MGQEVGERGRGCGREGWGRGGAGSRREREGMGSSREQETDEQRKGDRE